MAWSNLGGGDHQGANWSPGNGSQIAGVHTNIGIFTVPQGATVRVKDYSGSAYGQLSIEAGSVLILGTLTAEGAGYGGGGGGGGGAGGNGGWYENRAYAGGGYPGGPGGESGNAGEDCINPYDKAGECQYASGRRGGNGGRGGGAYGGSGGARGLGKSGNGGSGSYGVSGGYLGAAANGDSTTNETIRMGSGGGGGGGGYGRDD